MIISKKVSITRIISGTGRHFLFDLVTCVLTFFVFSRFQAFGIELPVLIPSVLGTALAFFIGFNNNQAYDRWWEARKIWGALVNDSRTWARQVLFFYKDKPEMSKVAIDRHIAFVYALKENLRDSNAKEYLKYLSEEDQAYIANESNKPNAILSIQTRELNEAYNNGEIDGFKFLELNKMLVNFCNEMGKSERISNTVFPTTYNYYTSIFIWVFIVTVTAVASQSVGILSIAVGTLIGYVFLTTHKIGQSLLNPFEEIPTGIPITQISRTIEINMLQTRKETVLPPVIESIDGEFIM
ncbi:bestrophin family protein [Arcticibacterium luteifluviistationis]|uniref:Bestrophin n=1 Tax=Arcticibacterium luteifluviistationis TaxID=1784714 RepID=A0A2Z4G842_9BACT|nr:bestrophin family ion channel [Arcticibacterium luteifluviistationis]AWV97351.1 hypothetical protein DJ013_03860 [Arcticibacterium luteifluviistationis]